MIWKKLSWFQTSLPLTASPRHCLITACHFRVASLSKHAALAFSPRRIALKSTVCDLLLWAKRREYRLIGLTLLTAWSSLCGKWRLCSWTISPSKRQCREWQASLKAALRWKTQKAKKSFDCCKLFWDFIPTKSTDSFQFLELLFEVKRQPYLSS